MRLIVELFIHREIKGSKRSGVFQGRRSTVLMGFL
jgi:hypothetical protein